MALMTCPIEVKAKIDINVFLTQAGKVFMKTGGAAVKIYHALPSVRTEEKRNDSERMIIKGTESLKDLKNRMDAKDIKELDRLLEK